MIWRRALPRVAALLGLALATGAGGSAAAPSAPALELARNAALVRTLDLATLRRECGVQRIAIDDPYYGRRVEYLACPLAAVLRLGLGAEGLPGPDDNVFLRALDGYVKPASGARLLEPGGFLAFADASLSEGASTDPGAKLVPRFAPIDRRQVDPAPFYLVWADPVRQDVHRYPWPYQLARIDVAPFEREYPHTAPAGLPPEHAAWAGFARFRAECIACHAINGEGGKIGPDLNVPRSIVEYRPAEQIRAYVRDPRAFRYTTMPAHPHLGDADLDALLAYFRAMSERKHDAATSTPH